MNSSQSREHELEMASTIHQEFIQNLADQPSEASLEAVESYHRALFLQRHGKNLERFQQQRQLQKDRLSYLEPRWRRMREDLTHVKPFAPAQAENDRSPEAPLTSQPWHAWDITMFVVSILGIVTLLTFGVLNVSFNLLESGLVTFMEHPIRAYFWAALLPVGALAVKVGWDFLQSAHWKSLYLWASLAIGLAGVLVWLGAYAVVYPTLSKTAEEQIAALSVFDDAADSSPALANHQAKAVDTAIVASQAMAEIFLSAVLGMYMTVLYRRHRPIRLAPEPGFAQWEEACLNLEREIGRTRQALADAKGDEDRLTHQLSVFVSFARSLYEKEVHSRRDRGYQKRRLLEQITEEFKTRLESVQNDPAFAEEKGNSRLALQTHSQT